MLQTDRLILRGPLESDLEEMFALYSDPRAMRYWSTAPHASIAITRDMLERRFQGWAEQPTYFQIELDGRFIGNAGNHSGTEVGFILHPDYWRKGVITEAMNTIIPHLWKTTDYPQLTADADPLNLASVGCLKALGFRETHRATRTFCINGVWSDSVYLALPRPAPHDN